MIKLEYPRGATPIDGDELGGLIPSISLQSELNEFERENIRSALRWSKTSRKMRKDLLTVEGLKLLHEKMFGGVWEWAGTFRKTEKNIGIAQPWQIQVELLKLCEDVRYKVDSGLIEDWVYSAVEFHHRLVSIHPFPNGNGRHARLAADLFLEFNDQRPLLWGRSELVENSTVRSEYIRVLKLADAGDLKPLVAFAIGDKT